MIHEEKKVAKIIEELTMFFFTVGSDEIETRIKRSEHSDYIWVRANYDPEYRDELDYLKEFLNLKCKIKVKKQLKFVKKCLLTPDLFPTFARELPDQAVDITQTRPRLSQEF